MKYFLFISVLFLIFLNVGCSSCSQDSGLTSSSSSVSSNPVTNTYKNVVLTNIRYCSDSFGTNSFVFYSYNSIGKITNEIVSNKNLGIIQITTYFYDSQNRVTNKSCVYPTSPTSNMEFIYTYGSNFVKEEILNCGVPNGQYSIITW